MSFAERLKVRLTPRASKNEVVGPEPDGSIRIRVAAPPIEGAANELLVKFLARKLGLRASSIKIVAGSKSRDKVVEVVGAEKIQQKLLSQD